MIRKMTSAGFLGLASLLAGCGEPSEPSLAMRLSWTYTALYAANQMSFCP